MTDSETGEADRQDPFRLTPVGKALLDVLRSGLYHVTTPWGYFGIRNSRLIQPCHGQPLFPNAAECFARTMSFVALFDFTTVSGEQLTNIDRTWEGYFPPPGSKIAIALRIERSMLGEAYVPSEVGRTGRSLCFSYVECWSRTPIPWSHVDGGFVFVPGQPPVSFSRDDGGFEELDAVLKPLHGAR